MHCAFYRINCQEILQNKIFGRDAKESGYFETRPLAGQRLKAKGDLAAVVGLLGSRVSRIKVVASHIANSFTLFIMRRNFACFGH